MPCVARLAFSDKRIDSSAEESDDEIARSRKAPKQRLRDNAPRLRHELDQLLAQPMMARGVSAKYPTSGSRVVIDDLLASKSEFSPAKVGIKALMHSGL